MIATIAEFFGHVLSFIYGVIPNFAVSIIILTLIIKLITFPLNNKQIQSARRMQKLQPELKKIQNKYKNDKEKQNKEVMAFMQENKMNPLADCLPLLVQFPVLIGIFQLLRNVEEIMPEFVFNPFLFPFGAETFTHEVSGQVFTGFINLLALANTNTLFYIFPIIAGATTFVYQKLTMTDTNQKMLLYMMPAMITFFSFQFPVGLVIYWIMNNVFSMGQHYLVDYMGKMKEEQSEQSGSKGEKGEK